MGAKMTKELGVYNEEERVCKVCTPLAPQRYRQLYTDPRSATLGIVRTPIQVECTPTSAKTVRQAARVQESDREVINAEEVKEKECATIEEDINKIDVVINEIEEVEGVEDISTEHHEKYLETNIDQLDISSSGSDQPASKREKTIHLLDDVRSPSLMINRTPMLVQCTPELFALHSHIESLSFCDFDVHTDDPSVIVSEDDQTSQNNQSSINDWLANIDQKSTETPLATPHLDSPKTVARKQKELNNLKKQLFFTPNLSEAANEPAKPKARTPLGNLQAGQLKDSPQKVMRAKQWRNIQEERQRRGIPDTENTPPSLPPLSKISSAPGKMLDRKRSKINWDEDNALLI